MEKSSFPQYRKYPNERHYFRIHSSDSFEELSITGKYYSLKQFKASILPDRVLIEDMLKMEGHWHLCSEEEFLLKMEYCEKNLIRMN